MKKEIEYNGRKVTPEEWNDHRREHNLFAMNDLMEIISRAINEKQIELVRERIIDSEISNLKSLIPQHYASE